MCVVCEGGISASHPVSLKKYKEKKYLKISVFVYLTTEHY